MENFIVSARKYRPDTFQSVVGQASITSTLKNAIKNSQLGHAYLFSGPRGVGKTTCARIFAKTINCQSLSDKLEACNSCESCISFNESRAYNIHELDAASNNSVEDIRSLTEQVRIPPQVGKYSVYIIDEVHMLSQQAFNAFLKTLEEPPAHAIFILATTEKHKIIPTILSRCQIYDFNRIQTEDSVAYLKYISEQEQISFEEDALHVIAQKAEGAMRDALSIFDQVVSFSENKITYASVIENLNILDVVYYFKLTDYFVENNISGSLLTLNGILEKGFDSRNFLNGLASHLRDLLVAKNPETAVLLDVGKNIRDQYLQQAKNVPQEFIFEALDICTNADAHMRTSKNQRLTVELALVKLTNLTKVQKKLVEVTADTKKPVPKKQKQDEIPAEIVNSDKQQPDASAVVEEKEKNETVDDSGKENSRENRTVHTKSISIKSVLKGTVREIPLTDEEIGENDQVSKIKSTLQKEEITENDIQSAWLNYAEKIEGKFPRQYNTLIKNVPKLTAEGLIRVELSTNAQKENFNLHIKQGLVNFFRQALKDIDYNFEITVVENRASAKKIYTDQDKFEFLISKNKNLELFKSRFNLDIDQ